MSNERMTEVKSVQQEPEREQRIFTFKITQLIWLFLGILEALIALRIGLKLIGANPGEPDRFPDLWVYLPVPVPL